MSLLQLIYEQEFLENLSLIENQFLHLKVSVPDKGLNFDAETDLIKGTWLNFKFQTILYLAGSGFKVADVDLATTEDGYLEQTLRWTTAERGKRYELMLRLHYTEVYNDLSEQEKKEIAKERLVNLQKALEDHQIKKNTSFLNSSVEVLVENKLKNQENYFGRNVFLNSVLFKGEDKYIGKIVNVKIEKTNRNTLFGRIDKNKSMRAAQFEHSQL